MDASIKMQSLIAIIPTSSCDNKKMFLKITTTKKKAKNYFSMPTRFSSSCDRFVHDVVCHNKKHLIQFETPSQNVRQLQVSRTGLSVCHTVIRVQKSQRPNLLSVANVVVEHLIE
jgi:hypothetical protein